MWTPSGWKDIGIRKLLFVAKTQLFSEEIEQSYFYIFVPMDCENLYNFKLFDLPELKFEISKFYDI